jgi:D-alanine transaminase
MLYLNGRIMPLSEGTVRVEDRGFQLGDGVYEVLKIENGRLLWVDDHLERLASSLEQIVLQGALDAHPLERILPELVQRSGVRQGTAYIQVTRGPSPRDFEFPADPKPTVLAYVQRHGFPGPAEVLTGLTLHAVDDPRWARCDIKSTNLLPAVLAKHTAQRYGAQEVLYVASDGTVREGGSSNVFVILDGALRTHPADNHILNGITRCHVLDLAREQGLSVLEQAVDLAGLLRAEEVFIASTTRDVMPVVRVGGLDRLTATAALPRDAVGLQDTEATGILVPGDGQPGPVTLLLADAMRGLVSRLVGLEPPPPLGS